MNALVWRPYYITLPGNVPRCRYRHAILNGVVFVLDENGPLSIGQDAARVVREMHDFYAPGSINQAPCILVRDGNTWSGFDHVGGVFLSYNFGIRESIAVDTWNEIQTYLPP